MRVQDTSSGLMFYVARHVVSVDKDPLRVAIKPCDGDTPFRTEETLVSVGRDCMTFVPRGR